MSTNRMGWVSALMLVGVVATVGWGLHSQRRQGEESLRREIASLPDGDAWSGTDPEDVDPRLVQEYFEWQEHVWRGLLERNSSAPQALAASRQLWRRLLEGTRDAETARSESLLPITEDDLERLDELLKRDLRIDSDAWAAGDRLPKADPLRPRLPNMALASQVTQRLAIRALQSDADGVAPELERLDAYVQAHLPPRTVIDAVFCMSFLAVRNQTVVALASRGLLSDEHPLRLHSGEYFEWAAAALQGEVAALATSLEEWGETAGMDLETPRQAGPPSSPFSTLIDWVHTPGDLAQAIRYLRAVADDVRHARMPKLQMADVIAQMRSSRVPDLLQNPNTLLMTSMRRSLERKLDLVTAQALRWSKRHGRAPHDQGEFTSGVSDIAENLLPRVTLRYDRLSETSFVVEVDQKTLPPWYAPSEGRTSVVVSWTSR